ncbi:MAG TPA: AimR family lysis-lysogeny pheromone receptor [Bacillota bacterium]
MDDAKTKSEFDRIREKDMPFGHVMMLLLQEHDYEVAHALTRDYCLQSVAYDTCKACMEFLYMNGYFQDLKVLVDKNKHSKQRSNQQWAEVYDMIIDRRMKRQPSHILLQRLNRFETSEPNLTCLIELTKLSIYYDQNKFGKIGNLLEIQSELFGQVNDPFLLTSFDLRLYQLLFIYYWVRNELIMARKYAFRALNETNSVSTKAALHTNLGLTYTFDTYTQGMYHFKEALKIAHTYELKNVQHSVRQKNIPFFSAHFKRVDDIETDDPSEQAHIEIAKGNYSKAIKILEQVPLDSPFKLYYMGLAKRDETLLMQSYNEFINVRSDYFFSRLPLNALKSMNKS